MINFLLDNSLLILSYLFFTVLLSFFLTQKIFNFSIKKNICDDPKSAISRKMQKHPIPLLGGTGACLAGLIAISVFWLFLKFGYLNPYFSNNLSIFKLYYLIIAGLMMLFVGYLDDRYQLSAKWQFLSILTVIAITIFLGQIRIDNITYFGQIDYYISVFVTFAWLGFAIASTKFLDGHDGLVTSVGIVNFLTIANVAVMDKINQPIIFVFALILSCSFTVFLFYNFPNAVSYLGEGGSEFIGFMVGVLAILSGAKLATALSVLGWFIIDIFIVWFIRIREGRNPITSADRNHWHHRLLKFGLNKIQVLVVTWFLLIVSSYVGVYGDTNQKISLIISQIVILVGIYNFTPKQKEKQQKLAP